jgi:hypothetical protein
VESPMRTSCCGMCRRQTRCGSLESDDLPQTYAADRRGSPRRSCSAPAGTCRKAR